MTIPIGNKRRTCWRAALVAAALVTGGSLPAQAATFTVTSTADAVDSSPGDGVCAGVSGCTLRAAIQEANALPGSDTVALGAATYTLAIPGSGEDAAATGDLDITDTIDIVGVAAASTIVDGAGIDRVFDLFAGTSTIKHLAVRGGSTLVTGEDYGGGILARGASATVSDCVIESNIAVFGGGIAGFVGALSVNRTTIRANTAGGGGGLYSKGQCEIIACTIEGNLAESGGGLWVDLTGASVSLLNSTVSGNRAFENGGGSYTSYSSGSNSVLVNNSTFTANVADLDGGGVYLNNVSSAYSVEVANTIVSDNIDAGGQAPDCRTSGSSMIRSRGYNWLSSAAGCTFDPLSDPAGSVIGSSANLLPLASNGGPTQTHIPQASGAIDGGRTPPFGHSSFPFCLLTDQRGAFRLVGAACDMGAVEVGGAVPTTSTTTTTTTSTTTTTLVSGPCGDGILNLGEQCDDGNTDFGDCCDGFCQLVPSGFECLPGDGDPCTHELCDGAGACASHALPWAVLDPGRCLVSDVPSKTSLQLTDKTPDGGDKVTWRYGGGEGEDWGNVPFDTDPVTFCVYDGNGIVVRAAIPPDTLCNGRPCWSVTGSGVVTKFKDATLAFDGALSIQSKALPSPKGKAIFKGKGENLDLVAPPWSATVTAELSEPGGGCYQTTFTTPTKNVAGTYKAKGN